MPARWLPAVLREMNGSSWEDQGARGKPTDFREAAADLGWPEPG
jgi:hypothetical protein